MAFQSTRSQDRDLMAATLSPLSRYFNPLGRKTETIPRRAETYFLTISIHSVARPRHVQAVAAAEYRNFNPLGRKTETAKLNNY